MPGDIILPKWALLGFSYHQEKQAAARGNVLDTSKFSHIFHNKNVYRALCYPVYYK